MPASPPDRDDQASRRAAREVATRQLSGLLKQLQAGSGCTWDQLAAAAHVSRNTVRNYLGPALRRRDQRTLELLLDAMNAPSDQRDVVLELYPLTLDDGVNPQLPSTLVASAGTPGRPRLWRRFLPWIAAATLTVAALLTTALIGARGGGSSGAPPSVPVTSPSTAAAAPQASSPVDRTVEVSAQVPWNDTGVDVAVESELVISAEGIVYIAGSDTGKTPEGARGCVATADRRIAPGAHLAPGLTCVALVGRIGSGAPFEVGRGVRLIAPSSGRLTLGVNDNAFGDNSGAWTVHISVREQ